MIDDQVIDECEALARIIAPEIEQPLYVLNKPAGFDLRSVRAVHIDGPCVVLWDILKARGEWRGPGQSIVFSDKDISSEIALAVFLHELAHVLPFRPTADVESTPESRADCEGIIRDWQTNPGGQQRDVPAWMPDHDRDFHRIVLHLWWRAAFKAQVVAPFGPLGFGMYDLAAVQHYLAALGNEPLRMLQATFAEILATPAQKFIELWQYDLQLWMRANQHGRQATLCSQTLATVEIVIETFDQALQT